MYVAILLDYIPIFDDTLNLKLGKSAFKNTDTYKDLNVETKRVWLD